MNLIRNFVSLMALLALLGACGGGGGSSSGGNSSGGGGGAYSISLNRSSISESLEMGESITVRVQATFNGDGLVVGYPPGVSEVNWVYVEATGTSSPAAIDLYLAADGLAPGTYNTTLRFLTGNTAGTQTSYRDLPISISVTDSLRFTNAWELENFWALAGLATNSQSLQIHAINDWQIQVEYLDSELEWLTLSATSGAAQSGSATVQLSTLGVPAGDYNARLRLLDAVGVEQDSTMIYLNSFGGGVYLSGQSKELTTDATTADLAWTVELLSDYGTAGAALNWTLYSDVDWVNVVTTSGNLNGNKALEVEIDPDEILMLESGWHDASIHLEFDNDLIAPIELTMQLYLTLEHAFEFADSFNMLVDSTSGEDALQGNIAIKLAAGEAFQNSVISWSATSNTDWLSIQNGSGDTGENNTLSVLIDEDKLAALPNGDNNAVIVLSSSHPRFTASEHTATLNLQLPTVDAVGPYVAFSGKSSPLVIQGSGFNPEVDNTIHIGDYSVVADYVAPTQVRVQLPDSFSAGSYEVRSDNSLGLARASAELKVVDAPSYNNTSVSLPKPFRRIKLDAERRALFFTGWGANQMDRLQLNALGEWDYSSFPMSSLTAVELIIDGSELLAAVAGTGITDSILRINPTTLQLLGSSSAPDDFYETYDLILPMLDGQTLLIDSDQWPQGYYYPEWESFYPPSAHHTETFLSRDRSLFLGGGVNSSSESYSYDVVSKSFESRNFGSDFFRHLHVSLSSDGSRIVGGTNVYNQEFDLIGSLSPADYTFALAVSPDGSAVFTMRYIDDVATFFRHDISADSGPYPADAETLPLTLGEREYVADMIVSDDGNALFVLCTKTEWGEYDPSSSVLYVVPLD